MARPKKGTKPNQSVMGVVLPNQTDETNYQWNTDSRYTLIKKMRRTDPGVIGFLHAYKDPILTTSWSVNGEKRDQVDFVEQNLFKRIEWNAFINDCLFYLDYGNMVFEKCWVSENGKWWLDKLSPRFPGTFTWELGSDNKTWVTISQSAGGGTVHIPREKLMVFINEQEGNDMNGVSVLRQIYKPWKLKEKTEMSMDAIITRNGMGIPVARAPDTISDVDESRILEWLGNVAANDTAFFFEKGDVEFRFQGVEGQVVDPTPFVNHLSTEMLVAGAQGIMGLATSNRGSSSTGETLSGPYYDRIAAIASVICDVVNHELIPQMIDYNFGIQVDGVYPVIESAGITSKGIFSKAEAIVHLAQAGFMWPEKGINRYIRSAFNLPALPSGEDMAPVTTTPEKPKTEPTVPTKKVTPKSTK